MVVVMPDANISAAINLLAEHGLSAWQCGHVSHRDATNEPGAVLVSSHPCR